MNVGLGLINCVLIFVAFILVYSFHRLLCCWPWWGDIFLLPQNIVSSTTFLRLPLLPIQLCVSRRLQAYERRESSAPAFIIVGVFGNELTFFYESSKDPSWEWSYECGSIVIGERGPEHPSIMSLKHLANQESKSPGYGCGPKSSQSAARWLVA